ncbi:hypothetical protein S7711_00667 [Stachybotrys chartarum IBT 7711]|uniref:WDR59/RTC1-like RING zinc finger domain-containing protein n=1 Tax=Stachybotrys chartarum (strain CBS 109288 / IBT 7711) TaxID=1280523 RepID=A0A084AU20_STACB|nr:hypothetical protein S7711_00667 [Stachybotrys chartarum IBT 7711]
MAPFDSMADLPKKGKVIKSAFDSESFEADGSIHVDGFTGSATISPSGRDVALASPDGLAIIDLDSPYNPPRRLRSHGLPWLVVDVQWSPFAARDYWVVSTANHRALVWNLNRREDSSSGAIEHSLEGHSRAITDINFSAHHPDQLATCSVDGYVHCWDLRRPRQPAVTFCDWFAGATQVKYNRQDPHILASSHDRWLHIWDERYSREPLKSISAHTSKIYGLDWNRTRTTGILTCSLDKSIKFWDYNSSGDQPENIIRTDYPVWRARHTPFGWGVLAMPQNEPGDLYLYDRRRGPDEPLDKYLDPAAVFPGHGDCKAKEFLWRSRGGITEDGMDNREFQLVSWGTDNELKLHCPDADVLASVGHVKGAPARKGLILTRKGATYKTFRTVEDSSSRDRKSGTMSDPRVGSNSTNYRQSALTLGIGSSGNQRPQLTSAWRGPSMKARIASNPVADRSQSQLGWMKGITMTKRKTSDGQKGDLSKATDIFGHGYPDNDWEEPDTIQEELLRVGKKLPKVKFDNIDMDNLNLNASLNGPWGVDGDAIFIQVKIDIPTQYPRLKAPKFFIEKTFSMPPETHARLTREIHQLADQFLQQKQNCLEVAFTYLLGEVDLESSTTFFKNVRDLEDGLGGLNDESSSEDEDIPTGGSASMSQELPSHHDTNATLAVLNRSIVPPPPRTCGARFSYDGRLACFFPTKEEKARALFLVPTEVSKERPRGEPFFAGFGRIALETSSKSRYMADDGSGTDDQTDSEESETSSTSSSDSELESMPKMSLWCSTTRQLRKTWSEDRSVRSSGGGTGTGIGTGTGTGISRRRVGRPRNVVSVYDMRADLPSKKEFAQEYAIFGDGAMVCEHNAGVAEKYGYTDLGNVWRYLALILRAGIPLELLSENHNRDSILVIARNAVSKIGLQDVERLPYDTTPICGSDLKGKVKWGQHPLAVSFIRDLFEYYEKIADIQMLAMLSCIFGEASTDDAAAYAGSQLPQPETPLPLKAPSFSVDYFPIDATLWNNYSRSYTNSAVTTPGTLHTPIYLAGSPASEDIAWQGEPESNSYSCGETPPSKGRDEITELVVSSRLSKSPKGNMVQRVNSGFASAFAANLPRSFTRGHSSSPPTHGRKKTSPAEAVLGSLAPSTGSLTWGSAAAAGIADSGGGRTSLSDDEYRTEDALPLVPVDVHVTVEDQTLFDDDGWLNTPLLKSSQAPLYVNYRYAYAEMLQMWNQPLARLEIMKFNVLKEDMSAVIDGGFSDPHLPSEGVGAGIARPKSGSSPIVMGKKDQLHSLLASGRGLDVTGICRVHEIQLEPQQYTSSSRNVGGAVGSCDRCRRRVQSQLTCVYCLEPVSGLYPPCLSCGCASHDRCLEEWHAAGETLCPAGDECNCVEEASNGQVESWAALQAAMLKAQKLPRLPSPAMDDTVEEGVDGHTGWERVHRGLLGRVDKPVVSPTTLSFGGLRRATGDWSRASSVKRTEPRPSFT